jgi:hypothetical protein
MMMMTEKRKRRTKKRIQKRRFSRKWKGGISSKRMEMVNIDNGKITEMNHDFGKNGTNNATYHDLSPNHTLIDTYSNDLINATTIESKIMNLLGLFKELVKVGETLNEYEVYLVELDKYNASQSQGQAQAQTTATPTQAPNQPTQPPGTQPQITVDQLDNARKALKKHMLHLIKVIRQIKYLNMPDWVDTLQYRFDSELLNKIFRGDIFMIINELLKPKPENRIKGVSIQMDLYDSKLNRPGINTKKKMIVNTQVYGNNPIEDVNEVLNTLYEQGQNMSLTTPIVPPKPVSSKTQKINMIKLNP